MGIGIVFNEQNLSDKNFGKSDFIKYGYLDYIQGDGNSYIETNFTGYREVWQDTPGVIPENLPKIEVDFIGVKIEDNIYADSYIFGIKDKLDPVGRFYRNTILASGRGAIFKNDGYDEGVEYNLIYGAVQSYVNGNLVSDNSNGERQYRLNAYETPICLFAGFYTDYGFGCSKQKIKRFKAYTGDKLILDLRPYRKSDGTVCMIDDLTKEFYYNQGTGNFIGK